MRSTSTIEQFRHDLVSWFEREGKSYPWRDTTDPWYILVSEIMLQQTTIPTVLGRYSAWMAQFPTPAHLAKVSEEEALRSWEGLGYYRRVRSLQAIAKAVMERHGGIFPDDKALLLALPGIGDYTAGALLSFAFNRPAPIVDANVERVITRLDDYRENVDKGPGRKYLWARAEELVDPEHARSFNSAIMELGQRFCKSTSPECLLCPVRAHCQCPDPESLPVKTPKVSVTKETHHDIFVIQKGALLLVKQQEGQRHEGMYRFPQRSENEVKQGERIARQTYSVTRYKITRYLHHLDSALDAAQARNGEQFVSLSQLDSLPMASPDRKILKNLAVQKLIHQGKSAC
jgi:A/G-specific adenine glycosylase